MTDPTSATASRGDVSLAQLFVIFLRLGLTSFGGPAAHLAFFREEFVGRRRWLSDKAYGEIVAFCQLLPGPASSQVGLTLGFLQRSYAGAAVAWFAFTLPSALIMAGFALGLGLWPEGADGGWIDGLKLFVVAVVAQAVWQMGRNLCPDAPRLSLALLSAAALLLLDSVSSQLLVLVLAGAAASFMGLGERGSGDELSLPVRGRGALVFAGLFLALLLLSLLPQEPGSQLWIAAELYRAGALVFGGGHVALPWLQESFVASGTLPADTFLAGYGVAQAVPGPLFSFSSFLGAAEGGVPGALIGTLAVFLPGSLLVFAGLPLWRYLRSHPRASAALAGVNAGVVGLLLAALYDPLWTSAVHSGNDLALVLILWAALTLWRVPVWVLAPVSAAAGFLLL